jgi:hypothetical protein
LDVDAGLGRAAAQYARRGWFVFPLKPRAKEPLTAHGVHDASDDPQVVVAWWREWPTANVGLDVHRSGLVVVDLDPAKGGIESWETVCVEHALEPYATLRSRTGSGGMHLVYRAPLGLTVRNSAEKLGAGIDVRGRGGYIVLPPSLHPNGTPYAWIEDG